MHVAAQSYTVRDVVGEYVVITGVLSHLITVKPIDFFLGDEISITASCGFIRGLSSGQWKTEDRTHIALS